MTWGLMFVLHLLQITFIVLIVKNERSQKLREKRIAQMFADQRKLIEEYSKKQKEREERIRFFLTR